MKKIALLSILALSIVSCKKDDDSPTSQSETYFEYDGKTYGLSDGLFIRYGEHSNSVCEFDIFMYSGLQIYNVDSVTGSGNYVGFLICSIDPDIGSGNYTHSDIDFVDETWRFGRFVLNWIEGAGTQNYITIKTGNIVINNNSGVFDISFECKSEDGKILKGRYKGIPAIWDDSKSIP